MLINLIIKDFMLIKKYLLILLAFTAIAPIYLSSQLQLSDGGLASFLLTVLLVEYILFGTISKAEDKYKGAALLCATPYTRKTFVKAKYFFVFVIFMFIVVIRIITAIIAPLSIEKLSVDALGITFLTLSIIFGVLLPLQFKFGYDKTRFISFVIIFLIPFVSPVLIREIQSNPFSFTITLPFPQIIQAWLPCLVSLIIGFISMIISLKIYAKKDL
ncbi:ABC-2 transporter permease [Bacillus swezeyi]|uniref:ABC-2 transporter permease n=1 Tax=Bacillus swezeyi TaxID=1925020 RepID=UPI002E1A2DF4|nr:ABC-2 transporter permease [Bacillus swezeyi]